MDVDQYAAGRWIPGCQLILEWEGEDQKPVRLRHKVQLIGAKPPNNYFNLTLKSTVEGKVGQNIFYAVSDITLLIGNLLNSRNLLLLGSSTLCWHCFEHNREILAQGIMPAQYTVGKILNQFT